MKVVAIILVAGKSTRFDSTVSKQVFLLRGKPVFTYSLGAFATHPEISETCIVTTRELLPSIESFIKFSRYQNVKVIVGGDTRQKSVENALKYFEALEPDDIVIIHDGARPLIEKENIDAVIQGVKADGAVTTFIPVEDSVASINEKGQIENYIDRKRMIKIQTPQAFKFDIIKKAHENAYGDDATDDCSLVLNMYYKVKLVQGTKRLSKLTTIDDAKFLENFLK